MSDRGWSANDTAPDRIRQRLLALKAAVLAVEQLYKHATANVSAITGVSSRDELTQRDSDVAEILDLISSGYRETECVRDRDEALGWTNN